MTTTASACPLSPSTAKAEPMKHALITLTLAAALAGGSTPALAAEDHDHADTHAHSASHGGILVEGKQADYELVAKNGHIRLYVSNHGTPRDITQASATLTLLPPNGERQEMQLTPEGDALHAEGAFPLTAGTKAIAIVTDAGKTLGTARFSLP